MIGTARLLVGDVFERLADVEKHSVDLAISSPPFLALRDYLPADHPDKAKEIGSEATPAEFLDVLLHLVAAVDRVLAPHGTLAFELGDTYAGSGGAGGDYAEGGLRDGQPAFDGSARRERRIAMPDGRTIPPNGISNGQARSGSGWPLEKSLTLLPTLFPACLAYGVNLLTGEPSPAGRWRIRNVIPWCRPNPAPGALGDKWRPATSYVTVACRNVRRYHDLDAVRTDAVNPNRQYTNGNKAEQAEAAGVFRFTERTVNPAGSPPLDWFLDDEPWTDPLATHQPDDGLWVIPTEQFAGRHYATFPRELVRRLVESMCPREVCTDCGTPRRRLVDVTYVDQQGRTVEGNKWASAQADGLYAHGNKHDGIHRSATTRGWTDCGHGAYRPGLVLDPFVGSGTTLTVSVRCERDALGIDIDERNVSLVRGRLRTSALTVDGAEPDAPWPSDSLFSQLD